MKRILSWTRALHVSLLTKYPPGNSNLQNDRHLLHSSMATALLLHHIPFNPQSPNPNPNSLKSHYPRSSTITCSTTTSEALSAKRHLLNLISDQERGLKTLNNPSKRSEIVEAIDAMVVLGQDTVTTGDSLSATWRLLWTTEKEQLFIIEKAPLFGTQAGDVLQINIEIASSKRVNFRFTSAVLRGKDWEFPLAAIWPGLQFDALLPLVLETVCWTMAFQLSLIRFESVYLDDDIRVVKDIRGDYLVVDRAPYAWKE
ncbi:putative plastid-lipid-associated protein 11, chloroplastic [Vitis vinifera]|uniref:Putative plastid-lipid-associated protein 11, chloroplastic n=1 Tax=Vitis vinifera TaxID=29760 RepID=A0A438IK88_VITVI|nr:putative plastid-lipid-associated protein 11, chloroplastic [Vitis vinifera]